MSFSATLFQMPLTAIPFSQLLLSVVELTLVGGLLLFFQPLLAGIARALVLVVRPRPPRQAAVATAEAVDALGAHS